MDKSGKLDVEVRFGRVDMRGREDNVVRWVGKTPRQSIVEVKPPPLLAGLRGSVVGLKLRADVESAVPKDFISQDRVTWDWCLMWSIGWCSVSKSSGMEDGKLSLQPPEGSVSFPLSSPMSSCSVL
jgi:hypothetical protein